MGSTQRREREKQRLRARIIDAARELFAEHGFEAVTMRKIAERIEYTPTAIYFHFPDKDALIRELCVGDFKAFGEHFASIASIGDPVERLRQAGHVYAEFAITHPQHYRVMFMMPDTSKPEDVEWLGDPAHDAYAFLRWTVQEGIDRGRFRPEYQDAELMAQIAWATVHGVVSLHVTHCQSKMIDWRPVKERVAGAIEAMLRGTTVGHEPRETTAKPAKGAKKKKEL
jgi:AcrR family transcriptional regulator